MINSSLLKLIFPVLLIVASNYCCAQNSISLCPVTGSKNDCYTKSILADMDYEGQFRFDKPDGHGQGKFKNGAIYVGNFINGSRAGVGKQTFLDGTVYIGEFKDGLFNGIGTGNLPDGTKYVGEYFNGRRNGFGVWTHPDGRKYIGEWRNHKRNGEGIEYSKNRDSNLSGKWVEGSLSISYSLNGNLFNSSLIKVNQQIDKIAYALEAVLHSRKKHQELEERLVLAQNQPPTSPLVTERRVALVVGNARYKNSPLANPVNDALDMSATLTDLGFQVTTVQDASLRKLREATRIFQSSVASADVALIFYAGHAVESKGRNFVIPVDADVARDYELEDQAYDAQQWLAMLGETQDQNRQRVNIVILDACRDNPIARQWRSSSNGLGRMDAPSGTLLVYSTAPGKVASDGPKGQRNSPFTKNLLRSMQKPNLPVEQVLKDVRRQVHSDTKGEQVPWENSSLIGDFVFKRQP